MELSEIPLSVHFTLLPRINQLRTASQRIPQSHTDHQILKSMQEKQKTSHSVVLSNRPIDQRLRKLTVSILMGRYDDS